MNEETGSRRWSELPARANARRSCLRDESTDGTPEEVRRMQALFPDRDIRLVEGPSDLQSREHLGRLSSCTGSVFALELAEFAFTKLKRNLALNVYRM